MARQTSQLLRMHVIGKYLIFNFQPTEARNTTKSYFCLLSFFLHPICNLSLREVTIN